MHFCSDSAVIAHVSEILCCQVPSVCIIFISTKQHLSQRKLCWRTSFRSTETQGNSQNSSWPDSHGDCARQASFRCNICPTNTWKQLFREWVGTIHQDFSYTIFIVIDGNCSREMLLHNIQRFQGVFFVGYFFPHHLIPDGLCPLFCFVFKVTFYLDCARVLWAIFYDGIYGLQIGTVHLFCG